MFNSSGVRASWRTSGGILAKLSATGTVLFLAQDAEPGGGTAVQRVLAVDRDQVVFAIAEEREVVVADPLEERGGLGEVLDGHGRRLLVQLGDQLVEAVGHQRPVLHRGTDIGQDTA